MNSKYILAWAAGFAVLALSHFFIIRILMREKFFELYNKGILRFPEKVNFAVIYVLSLLGFMSILLVSFEAYMPMVNIAPYWVGIFFGIMVPLVSTAAWLSVNVPHSFIWLISSVEFFSFIIAGFVISFVIS